MKTSPLLVTLTVVIAAGLPAAAAEHPLDPLSGSEIWRTLVLLRDAGHLDRDTKFSQLTLQEPAKQDVLAWKAGDPMPRRPNLDSRQFCRITTLSRTGMFG